MADVIESTGTSTMKDFKEIPSNGKANAGLTLGIIGTALSVLGTGTVGLLSGKSKSSTGATDSGVTDSDLANTKAQWQNYLDITKQYYEGKIDGNERLTNAFFDAYKRDIDNSFALYKNQRDEDDSIKATMNSNFFQMYQLEQSDKNSLSNKISDVDKKVDIMMATRPYQDALINSKIDNNALIAAYELQKRTCRMIEGEIVLPSTPTVTGFPSYGLYSYLNPNSSTNTTA